MKHDFFLIKLISILFLFLIVVIYFTSTYSHENAHKEFSKHNGCNKYEISYFINPHFKCLNRSYNLTETEKNTEYVLDSINEIVGYNTSSTWLAIMLSSFMICLTMAIIYIDFEYSQKKK